MTWLRRIATICALCLMLGGCSGTLTNCKVVDKERINAYMTMLPIYNGKTMIFVPQWHPEAWYLVVEGENEDGELRRTRVQVEEAVYEQTVIGQEWAERNSE